MSGMDKIVFALGSPVCLRCINRRFRLRLTPQDCVLSDSPQKCRCCETMHRGVETLRFSGKLKLLFLRGWDK